MTKRKTGSKGAKVNTPIAQLDKKETLMHYHAVILEDVHSKMQLVLEGLKANSDRLVHVESAIARLEEGYAKIPLILEAVKANSDRLLTVESAVRGLKEDMLDMEHRLSSKINRITERFDHHEAQHALLEATS